MSPFLWIIAPLVSMAVLGFFVHATLLRIMHALERISGHLNRISAEQARDRR